MTIGRRIVGNDRSPFGGEKIPVRDIPGGGYAGKGDPVLRRRGSNLRRPLAKVF